MRLSKFIAQASGLSRRQADDLIASGKVKINAQVAILGQRYEENDKVLVDNKIIKPHKYTYLLVNKPIGYVCSRAQQSDKPTIYALLPKQYHGLKTVGRLDADSHGLILLTDDGDFAQSLTHPSFNKSKIYKLRLDKDLEPSDEQALTRGLELKDGLSRMDIEQISPKSLVITLHQGRNRQIRRSFGDLGYTVLDLFRTNFGPYSIDNLEKKVYNTSVKVEKE